jgi:hypothetical protein
MKSLFIILISSFPLLINAQSNFKTLYQNDQLNSYPELTRGEKEKFESSNRLNSNQTFNLKSMTSLHLKHKDIKENKLQIQSANQPLVMQVQK